MLARCEWIGTLQDVAPRQQRDHNCRLWCDLRGEGLRYYFSVPNDKRVGWSKISMLDTYGHVMTDEKIAAQGSMLERIIPKTNAVQ